MGNEESRGIDPAIKTEMLEARFERFLALQSVEGLVELYEMTYLFDGLKFEESPVDSEWARRRIRTALSMRDLKSYSEFMLSTNPSVRCFFEHLWLNEEDRTVDVEQKEDPEASRLYVWHDEQMWHRGSPISMREVLEAVPSRDDLPSSTSTKFSLDELIKAGIVVRFPGDHDEEHYMLRGEVTGLYLGAILDLVEHHETEGEPHWTRAELSLTRQILECIELGLLEKYVLADIPRDLVAEARGS